MKSGFIKTIAGLLRRKKIWAVSPKINKSLIHGKEK
jgi:hypothetical protein